MSDEVTDGYTVSFKTSSGYDASLIVVRGNDEQELANKLDDLLNTETLEKVVDLEYHLHAVFNAKAPVDDTPTEEKPARKSGGGGGGGSIKTCEHGKRNFVDKGSWAAWFCPQKDKSKQCEPIWRDDK